MNVLPFEVEFPGAAKHLMELAGKKHPLIKGASFSVAGNIYIMRTGERKAFLAERNDPCRCGSGKKFKKCCLK